MNRRLVGPFGPLWTALLTLCACTTVKSGSDRAPLITTSLPDAAIGDGAAVCSHKVPPPRPTVTGSGGSHDIVFAISQSEFGTSSFDDAGLPMYRHYGLDLDDTCTGEGQGASCIEPAWATAKHDDGVSGVDNSSAQWFSDTFGTSSPDSVEATAAAAEILFRVSGYSGGPDDDAVKVSLYVGFGLDPRPDGSDGGGAYPHWDGQDRWQVLPDVLVPLKGDGGLPEYSVDQPLFYDDTAYVTGGVLVARIAHGLVPSGIAFAPKSLLPVEQFVMMGQLIQNGSLWELRDVASGVRSPIQSQLIGVSQIRQSIDMTQPICQSTSLYDDAKRRICEYVDISSGPDSPSSICDAVSGGSFFQAKEALLGEIATPGPALPPCAPGIHPETDTCASD